MCGYELLYRAQQTDRACTTAGDLAAARVVTDALLGIGLDALTSGEPAFLNFTRDLLLANVAELLPTKDVVIELREDIVVDEQVVEACRDLKAKGFTIALDDFVADSDAEQLLPFASFVKLDVHGTPPIIWQPLAHRLASTSVRVVAERVETADIVAQAQDAGCTLFQGYYFCRPATQSAKALPARRLAYLNLFSAVNKPDLTINDLEDLVKRDVSLTMRVLRSINSAAYGLSNQITSVRHALVMLGVQQVKKWASVWAMAGLNSGGTPEVVAVALLRARSCEVVGNAWSGPDAGSELFLLGMCSMLDAIVNQPMEKSDRRSAPDARRTRGAPRRDRADANDPRRRRRARARRLGCLLTDRRRLIVAVGLDRPGLHRRAEVGARRVGQRRRRVEYTRSLSYGVSGASRTLAMGLCCEPTN